MDKYSNQRVESISVIGIPPRTQGTIQFMYPDGSFYIIWDTGLHSVIRERGDSYKFIDKPKKSSWNIKNYFLTLLKQFK